MADRISDTAVSIQRSQNISVSLCTVILGLAKNKIASILSRSSMGTSVRCFFEEWNNTQRFYFTFIDPEYFHYHIIQWREDVGRKLRCWNPFWWYFHRLLFMLHESIKWEAHTKVLLHSSTRSIKGVRDLYLVEYMGYFTQILPSDFEFLNLKLWLWLRSTYAVAIFKLLIICLMPSRN